MALINVQLKHCSKQKYIKNMGAKWMPKLHIQLQTLLWYVVHLTQGNMGVEFGKMSDHKESFVYLFIVLSWPSVLFTKLVNWVSAIDFKTELIFATTKWPPCFRSGRFMLSFSRFSTVFSSSRVLKLHFVLLNVWFF